MLFILISYSSYDTVLHTRVYKNTGVTMESLIPINAKIRWKAYETSSKNLPLCIEEGRTAIFGAGEDFNTDPAMAQNECKNPLISASIYREQVKKESKK